MAIIKIKNQAIDLDAAEIPNLPATKITSGTFDNARISLDAAEIPNLDTAKITTGTLADARVPDLNASKITAGTLADARVPNLNTSKITAGTLADARLPANALNSNIDLTNLSATNMTSGTLPDARFPSTLPAVSGANLTNLPGGGKILQVVQGLTGSDTATSNTDWTATALTANITPSSSNSKIIIMANGLFDNNGGGSQGDGAIYRDSTRLTSSGASGSFGGIYLSDPSQRLFGMLSTSILDAPSTTNQITYKLYIKHSGPGSTYVTFNSQGGTGYIILMEVSA